MTDEERAGAALIGSILQEPALAHDVAEVVQARQFGHWRHGQIFAAIEQVLGEGQLPTLTRINNTLRVDGCEPIEQEEGKRYAVPYTRKTTLHAAGFVAEQGRRRHLTNFASQMLESLKGGSDITSVELAERLVSGCVDVVTRGSVRHHDVAALAEGAHTRSVARHKGEEEVRRHKIGIPYIDERMRVVPRHNKIIFAGSGGGKTTFAFWYAIQFVIANPGMGAVFFSLADMDADALGARALSRFSNVSSTFTLFERPDTDEINAMADGLADMARIRGRFKVIEPGQFIESCVLHARRAHLEFARRGIKLGLVVVDYAQRAKTREQGLSDMHVLRKVSEVCLFEISRPLDCETLICSQMNRNQQQDSRGGQKRTPQTSDIAGGSDLERDAHCILAIDDIGAPKRKRLDANGKEVSPVPPEVERITLHRGYILKNRFMRNKGYIDLHADLATNRYYVPGDYRDPVTRWVEARAQLSAPLDQQPQPQPANAWGQP